MNLDLAAVFGAGVLTFVTPCILPVIPIYLAALAGVDRPGEGPRGVLVVRALLFSSGFIATFTALGLAAASVGGLLAAHRNVVKLAGGAIVLLFGLRFVGVLRLQIFDRVFRLDESRFRTRFAGVNAVLMGVLFAAGWSPCVGPVLGSVLTYAAASSTTPVAGAAYLGVYGLGLATPLVAVAAFAQAGVGFLRRLRPHLPRLERAAGALLLLLGIAMVAQGAVALVAERAAVGRDRAGALEMAGVMAPRTASHGPDGPLADGRPTVVQIAAANCPACRAMKPVIEGFARQCDEHGVHVVTVDIVTPLGRELARRHGVVGVPTFLVLDASGRAVNKLVGTKTEAELKEAVAPVVAKPCPEVPAAPPPERVAPCETAALGGGPGDAGAVSCDERGM